MNYRRLKKSTRPIVILFLAAFLLSACSKDEVLPPSITVTVNGNMVSNDQDTVKIAEGKVVEYSFNIQANLTIREIYLVKYTVKIVKNPSNPIEMIASEPVGSMSYPTGLTQSLNEEVKGILIYNAPAYEKYGVTHVVIVVSDTAGNESRKGFFLKKE